MSIMNIKRKEIEKRIYRTYDYMLETKHTIRKTAQELGVSKSTVFADIKRLEKLDNIKYQQLKEVLEFNKAERHIRGGNTTKHIHKKQEERLN